MAQAQLFRALVVAVTCVQSTINGYWDFDQQTFVREMIDTLARVPYDFPERVQDDIDEVHWHRTHPR